MTPLDLRSATTTMGALIADIPSARLDLATPCAEYTVGDLVDHVGGMALAFTAAAGKDPSVEGEGPSGDASRLPADWRTRIPAQLDALAEVWLDPTAWTGSTTVGGMSLAGEMAGLFALDELVIHAWDLSRACGFTVIFEPHLLEVVHGLLVPFAEPSQERARSGLFAPVVEVPDDAPLIERVVGLAGRNPRWSAFASR